MKKIKIVEWPHYHTAITSVVCEKFGWEEKVRKHMPFVKDEVTVVNQFIFVVYKN